MHTEPIAAMGSAADSASASAAIASAGSGSITVSGGRSCRGSRDDRSYRSLPIDMRVLRYRPLPHTLRAVVPDWLDAERLEWVILAVIAGLLVSVYVVLSFVRKVVTKFLLLLVIAAWCLAVDPARRSSGLRGDVPVHAVRRVRRAA